MIWHGFISSIYRTCQQHKAEKESVEFERILAYIEQLIEELNEKSQCSKVQ